MESDRLRVLVVDDEEGMREGMTRILARREVETETADSGEAALGLLETRTYDIALVDLKMPGVSGFDVARRIHEAAADRTVVVIVSALATVEAAVEVTRRGAFDFLVKPFSPQDLLEVFDRATHQRTLLREREIYLSELSTERNTSRQLLNCFQEGLVVLNVDAHPVLMNPRAEYLTGVRFRPDLHLDELFPLEARQAIRAVLSSESPRAEARVVSIRHGDSLLQVAVSVAWWQETISGAIVVIRDITAEWRVEQDKNRFIGMVAHELKSPLAAIINYLNVIQSGMLDNDLPKIHEILERCKTRGEALLELVRDLLHLNRRDAGKVEKNVETLDLTEVLRGQIEFLRGQADRRRIALSLVEEGAPLRVRADRGDLDRIFMNLITNGIKYNREGGSLDVRLSREGDDVVAQVADSGIGMRSEEMPGLFQEFYRVRNRQTKDIAGTGLGLATVKRVLSEYSGRIHVESVPEVGSTFTVRLPAVD
jgi:signal transduction histidine kinase